MRGAKCFSTVVEILVVLQLLLMNCSSGKKLWAMNSNCFLIHSTFQCFIINCPLTVVETVTKNFKIIMLIDVESPDTTWPLRGQRVKGCDLYASKICSVAFHLHDIVHVPFSSIRSPESTIWDFLHMEKTAAKNYSIAQKCFSVEFESRKSCKFLAKSGKCSHKTHSRGFE